MNGPSICYNHQLIDSVKITSHEEEQRNLTAAITATATGKKRHERHWCFCGDYDDMRENSPPDLCYFYSSLVSTLAFSTFHKLGYVYRLLCTTATALLLWF